MDIIKEQEAIEKRLAEIPHSYVDFDGARIDIPFTEEQKNDIYRLQMLEDLLCLSAPIMETDWGLDMRFGMCPCTQAVQEWHESMGVDYADC